MEEDTELRWMQGLGSGMGKVEIEQLDTERVEEWLDEAGQMKERQQQRERGGCT